MTVTVLIADDHELTMSGMRSAIGRMPAFEIVAETGNGLEAIKLCKRLNPALALLDMAMPGATGLEAFTEIRRWSPNTRVAIITGSAAPSIYETLENAGVDGLFVKNAPIKELHDGLKRLASGERVISSEAVQLINMDQPTEALSNRELQVLQGIANGLTNAGIAEGLCISPKTVDNHRTNMMRKLDVRSSAALVVQAVRNGLIQI